MATKTTNGNTPVNNSTINHRGPRAAAPTAAPAAPKADAKTLNRFTAGEFGNMEAYKYFHGDQVAYNGAYGWLFYSPKDKHWLSGDMADSHIDKSVQNLLLKRQKAAAEVRNDLIASKAAVTSSNVNNVKSLLRPHVTTPAEEFDNEPHLLNTVSGVIDLRTGAIVAHETNRFTYCVKTPYNPDLDYTPWLNWLDSTVGFHKDDPKMREYFQMCKGYSVTGYIREECLFYLHGPTRSGKGTLTNTYLSLLPKPLAATAAFTTFTRTRDGNNFDLAPLKPARLVVAHESSKGKGMNEAIAKTVTGGDYVRCSFKGKDEFDYLPQFKIWLASNHPVMGDPDDDAFWTRIKVIPFPNSNAGKEDKTLKERMAKPDYLAMVLAYSVRGAVMWWNSPTGLVTPDCVKEATQKHREDCDSIGKWIAECCVKLTADHWIGHKKLYADYENWCDDNGYEPRHAKAFTQSLRSKGYKDERKTEGNGFIGIGLLHNPSAKK